MVRRADGPSRGSVTAKKASGPQSPPVAGYEQQGPTVVLCCPDPACHFSDSLPVYVIDEDIYARYPSLLMCRDQFAMLAWRPDARAIFGFGDDGSRKRSPPA